MKYLVLQVPKVYSGSNIKEDVHVILTMSI